MNKLLSWLHLKNNLYGSLVLTSIIIAFLTGFFTIFTRQPMSWLDESSHYSRSIEITNGDILVSKNKEWSLVGGRITTAQKEFMVIGLNSRIGGTTVNPIDSHWPSRYKDIKYTDRLVFTASTNAVPYSPFNYMPYITVAAVNKVLRLKPSTEYLWMRIVGFVFFLFLVILAIKLTPIAKLPLALLLLIPTTILSAISVTADGFNIALSYLTFAFAMRLYIKFRKTTDNVSVIDLMGIGILTLLLVLSKIPSFFFIGLFIPLMIYGIKKHRVSKHQQYFLLIVAVFAFIVLIWWYLSISKVNTGAYFGRNVDTGKQISHILSNIFAYIQLLFGTIFNYNFFKFQLAYSNGQVESLMFIPQLSVWLYFIGLMLSYFIKDDVNQDDLPKTSDKSLVIGFEGMRVAILVGFVLAVFSILYLQFSEIGAPTIDGVQERYFIPLYFLLLSIPFRKWSVPNSYYLVTFALCSIPLINYLAFILIQLT